jgi:DNA-binding FadR family transcriptional regulator
MTLRAASRRLSLTSQVTEQLWAQIRSGEWRVGSRIPTEAELVRALAVGRNTIREAVRALTHVGVLEPRQGSGTFVTARFELAGLVARRLERVDVREALEVRRAFEVEAARLAARRRTEADLAGLDDALARLLSAWSAGELSSYVEADAALHTAVVRTAHNSVLADLYAEFGAALRSTISAKVGDDLAAERWGDQHAPLIEAIRRGDSEAAATQAASLIGTTRSLGRSAPPARPRTSVTSARRRPGSR